MDIGFNKPKNHAIQKGDNFFYSFYDKSWKGNDELRGLETHFYYMKNYVNEIDNGIVDGNNFHINVEFSRSLLLAEIPFKR